MRYLPIGDKINATVTRGSWRTLVCVTLTLLPSGGLSAEQVAELVARARERGTVTAADITSALDAADLPADAFDNVVRLLTDEGIEIVDPPAEEAADAPRGIAVDTTTRAGTGDLVRIYLREIGRVPLLSAQDEVELAKSIEAGLFAEEKLRGSFSLDGAEVADLEFLVAEGERAKQRLIEANLR